jgi:hypothetical protein
MPLGYEFIEFIEFTGWPLIRATDKLWKWIGYYSINSCGVGYWLHLIGYSKTCYPMILRSIGYSIIKIWISWLIMFFNYYYLPDGPNVPNCDSFCLHSGIMHIKHGPECLNNWRNFNYLELLYFKSSFVPYNVCMTAYCFQSVYWYRLFTWDLLIDGLSKTTVSAAL